MIIVMSRVKRMSFESRSSGENARIAQAGRRGVENEYDWTRCLVKHGKNGRQPSLTLGSGGSNTFAISLLSGVITGKVLSWHLPDECLLSPDPTNCNRDATRHVLSVVKRFPLAGFMQQDAKMDVDSTQAATALLTEHLQYTPLVR
jgi:hypothetical protein